MKSSARWELAAVGTASAAIMLNPFSYRVGSAFFGLFGDHKWYADENYSPTPSAFVIHIVVLFFIIYLFMRLDWDTDDCP